MQEVFFPKQKMLLVNFYYVFKKMKISKKRVIWRGVNKVCGGVNCTRFLLCENFKKQN